MSLRISFVRWFGGFGAMGMLALVPAGVMKSAPMDTHPPPNPPPLITTVTDAPALPVDIPVTDPAVGYIGRFDWRQGDPRCAWTASTIAIKFHGTDLNARFGDSGINCWEVELDGRPVRKLALGTGSHLYRIVGGLAEGDHVVRLVRATEAREGPTQFHGFQLNAGGSLRPLPAQAHRLEVIGDSISCGGANEGRPGVYRPSNVTQNGYFSYGVFAARRLDAEYHCVAWSGRKMWPDKTMPEVYGDTIPYEPGSVWDFSKWSPDAIVINLSTNDFGPVAPEEIAWTDAYKKFIGVLRGHFPRAAIYCATSPMLDERRLAVSKIYLAKVVRDLQAAGDGQVRLIEFETQDPTNGIGGAGHPNVATHRKMGEKLAAQLAHDLGWPRQTLD